MMHKFNKRIDGKSLENRVFYSVVEFAPAAAGFRRIHPDKASRLPTLFQMCFQDKILLYLCRKLGISNLVYNIYNSVFNHLDGI